MADKFPVEIEVDVRDAVRNLNKLEREIKDTGQTAGKAAGGLNTFQVNAAAMSANAQKALGVLRNMLSGLRDLGTEWERQSAVINRFTGDIDEAARRTNGLMSNLQLMEISNRAAQKGLQLTGRELANIVVRANEMASAVGEDAQGAAIKLAEALAKGEAGALEDFGIRLEGIASKSEVTSRALSQIERDFGGVESSADTLGGKIAALDTALENLKTEFIETFNEQDGFREGTSELTQAVRDLAESLGIELAEGFSLGGTAARIFDQTMANITRGIASTIRGIDFLAQAVGALSEGNLEKAQQLAQEGISALAEGGAMTTVASGAAFATVLGSGATGGATGSTRGSNAAASPTPNSRRARGGGPQEDRSSTGSFGEFFAGRDEVNKQIILANAERARQEAAEAHAERMESLEKDRVGAQQRWIRLLEEEEKQRRDIEEAERAAEEARQKGYRTSNDAINITSQAMNGLLDLVGANEGQKNLWYGLTETARAVASFASQEYAAGAGHTVAAAIHFANAAQMGVGGGAPAIPASTPTAPSNFEGQSGGDTTHVINFNSPVGDAQLGRMQRQADRAAQRRYGRAA